MTKWLNLTQFEFAPVSVDDDELADGAILIIRTQGPNDMTRLVTRTTDGVDWITARGMMEVARQGVVEAASSSPKMFDGPDKEDPDDYST